MITRVAFFAVTTIFGTAALAQPIDITPHFVPVAGYVAPAGGLSARDVKGKILNDANGAALGKIEKVTAEGALVRTPGGWLINVDMAKLRVEAGSKTVILASAEPQPNQILATNDTQPTN